MPHTACMHSHAPTWSCTLRFAPHCAVAPPAQAWITARAIAGPTPLSGRSAAVWLEQAVDVYRNQVARSLRTTDACVGGGTGDDGGGGSGTATAALMRLLAGNEPPSSPDLCWNWRSLHIDVHQSLVNRGSSYNGYAVSRTYFGAFSLDALAIALHSIHSTSSFGQAVEKSINFLGDADSTAAVAGQLAGERCCFLGFVGLRGWKGMCFDRMCFRLTDHADDVITRPAGVAPGARLLAR